MSIKYIYACKANTHSRKPSVIEDENGAKCESSGKPEAGHTAETRFFSSSFSVIPRFVVKRPKYSIFYEYFKTSVTMDDQLKPRYERERDLWNLFYPEKRAVLFSEGGLRLVLPYLPGKTLGQTKASDRLTRCQIALAMAYAFKKLHALGLYYGDLHEDNILIEEKSNHTFEAHLLDFDGAGEYPYHQEQGLLARFVSDLNLKRNRSGDSCDAMDEFIQDLLFEINRLSPKIQLIFQPGGNTLFSRYVDGLREEVDLRSWWHLNR